MKQRIVFALTMSFILTTLMTAWVTMINLGFSASYFTSWGKAFLLSWPAAAIFSFIIAPVVTKITHRLTAVEFS